MEGLEARLAHWDAGHTAINQGDSPPVPFVKYIELFRNKDVLEIGPGQGRQYGAVVDRARSCSIADISEKVLGHPIFYDAAYKFILRDFDTDFGVRFDLIHFWYVLHHIRREELPKFVNFLHRHLRPKGVLIFNTPYLGFSEGAYSNDGINTTRFDIGEVVHALDPLFFCLFVDGSDYRQSNGYIYVGRVHDGEKEPH